MLLNVSALKKSHSTLKSQSGQNKSVLRRFNKLNAQIHDKRLTSMQVKAIQRYSKKLTVNLLHENHEETMNDAEKPIIDLRSVTLEVFHNPL